QLGPIGVLISPARVRAQFHLGDRPGRVDPEGVVGQGDPAWLVTRVGAADALVDAVQRRQAFAFRRGAAVAGVTARITEAAAAVAAATAAAAAGAAAAAHPRPRPEQPAAAGGTADLLDLPCAAWGDRAAGLDHPRREALILGPPRRRGARRGRRPDQPS